MEPGDVAAVELGDCAGISYVDTGMYDVAGYGSVYVIDAPEPAVVDTGIGADYEHVQAAIEAAGIGEEDLAAIAVTHVHLDHAGGAGRLARDYPNATVYVHEIGATHLVDPERLVEGTKRAVGDQWQYYADPVPIPEDRIETLTDGDRIDLGDRELVAHHAPGHAPHQVVYHSPSDDAVFTADAAGIYVPERDAVEPTSPPPNFDPEQALADVETIRDLDPSVLCYAHFGPARTADHLAAYETVLADWVDAVAAAREELGGEDASDEAVVDRLLASVDTDELWGEEKAMAETAMNVRGVLVALDRS
ncbi:Zn-dependent hydrolase, glyoxylase [Salinarchaeum sp. Harcht-Bsk1]|uniref:MBL fold metallo-hydrolase n=1 Tax=Salinarchaeum sp. Harcht-Bsk1 TaxID=1333523 RepID=UPI0003424838|nr:MBL fold metallo-hydrolase [Salinarchaeum sp. Harcht-Bsk1]AGN02031.1 Zn-dependent hydrolase, glyoxylase [Salinarchaeum sp. Harcht-Bsk1]